MAKINTKILVTGLVTLVLSASTAGAGLWVSTDLIGGLSGSVESSKILRNHMQADMMHDALRADVVTALLATHGGGGASIADAKESLAEHVKLFRQSVADNDASATDPAMRAALDGVKSQLATYIDAAQAIVSLAETNPAAAQANLTAFQHSFEALETAMETAGDTIEARAESTAKVVADHARLAEVGMSALLAAALLLSGAIVLLARRMIVKPIRELTVDMGALASGRTDIVIRGAKRTDEIGEIGRAVRTFQGVIMQNMRSEADLVEQRRVQETEAQSRIETERAEAAAAQARIVQAIATGLDRQSQGDLTYRLTEPFPTSYEKLRVDFNSAMESLQAAMQTIADGIQAFQLGSEQISSASNDLAHRTEKQAASLEETAAALNQITATVETTSRGSAQARQVVSDAKSGAEHSGEIVRQAIGAMGEIERSSREVGNIIGVIDEIAFQTNLLALNAGVEAARAGDAGRGFAVVASEVRALAQRSAEAAKEIKTLVLASNQQVAHGVNLVGETGRALETIVAQVTQINTVVSDIATRTQEQAVALQEVNTAITQMDQVTQQNAAMVEQTTAASHSMVREAENLTNSVGRFRGFQTSRPGRPTRSKTPSSEPAQKERHRQVARAIPQKGGAALKIVESQDTSSWEEF